MTTEDLYRFGFAGFVVLMPIAATAALASRMDETPGTVAALILLAILFGFVLHQIWHSIFYSRVLHTRKRGCIDFIASKAGIDAVRAFRRWEYWIQSSPTASTGRDRSRRLFLLYHSFATIAAVSTVVSLLMLIDGWWPEGVGLVWLRPEPRSAWVVGYLALSLIFWHRRAHLWEELDTFEEHLARHAEPSWFGIEGETCRLCGLQRPWSLGQVSPSRDSRPIGNPRMQWTDFVAQLGRILTGTKRW